MITKIIVILIVLLSGLIPWVSATDFDFTSETRAGCGNEVCDLAIGPDGSWHIVWTSMSDGHVHYNHRNSSGGWGDSEAIPYSNDWGWQFNRGRIAVGADNVIHVVWGDSSNQHIYYTMRFPGSEWWYPRTIYTTNMSPGCSKPSVAAQTGAIAHILFERHYSTHIGIGYRQMIAGQSGSLITVSNYSYDNGDPNLVMGPDGSVHAIWITGGSSYIKMHYRRRNISGFWSTEEVLNHPGGAGSPDISISPGGDPYLSWVSFMRGGSGWYTDGVYYACKTGGSWTNGGAGYKISPGSKLAEAGYEVVAQGAFNSLGDFMVAWPKENVLQYRVLSGGSWNEPSEIPDAQSRFWVNVEGTGSRFALCAGDSGRCIWSREGYRSSKHHPPKILAAGFIGPDLMEGHPGTVDLLAAVYDEAGSDDIAAVEAWEVTPMGNIRIGLLADDGAHNDFGAGDYVFGIQIYKDSWTAGNQFIYITARDSRNDDALTWPHLHIESDAGAAWEPPDWKSLSYMSNTSKNHVQMAGYMFSDLHTGSDPSRLEILAWASDPMGYPADRITLFYQGIDTGIELLDDGSQGDGGAGDGFFGLQIDLPPHSLDNAGGNYLIELGAWDGYGNASSLWPYLFVKAAPTPAPSPVPTHPPFPTARPTIPPFHTPTPTPAPISHP